ncbi:MAG: type II toxin-antitoxin system PemK/MazF family toxin [Bifidobacteriaceae bacterium]|jgi:mRNA interferase MazF|nr:type II toxin-antitoxin system PemK/MazF family toxin [Bifidobacteriaceae bacterium]
MTPGIDSSQPRRGEIWLASLGNARPGEPGKSRPVVVVAADEFAPYALTDLVPVVPLSLSRAPSPSRVLLPARAGFDGDSVAVCRAVRGIPRNRLHLRLANLAAEELASLSHALAMTLGLA